MQIAEPTLNGQDTIKHHQQMEKIILCSEHGEYVSKFLEPRFKGLNGFWSKCPGCVKVQDQKEAEADLIIPWLTPRRKKMTIDSYVPRTDAQSKALSRVKKYVENFKTVFKLGSCLSLVGPPGTGKTHLATGMGVELVKRGHSVHYERLYDLTRRIKATYCNQSTDTEEQIINRLEAFDLLILDEVGLKNMTETESTLTYEIIDIRYEAVKPTVIISNLDEKSLEENLGQRTIDRLYENHGAFILVDGPSQRRS